MPTILMAEANLKTRRMLQRFLESKGLETRPAATALEALETLRTIRPGALVVGLGPAALRRLRGAGVEEPMLALLEEDTLAERERCFSAGADLWLPRPVDPEEVALLLWAMVRRWGGREKVAVALGEAWLDEHSRELRCPQGSLSLPPREYAILSLLMAHPRRIFTREEMMDRLWELGCESGPRSLDVYVARLRSRCRTEWGFHIQTVRGMGYRLMEGPGQKNDTPEPMDGEVRTRGYGCLQTAGAAGGGKC